MAQGVYLIQLTYYSVSSHLRKLIEKSKLSEWVVKLLQFESLCRDTPELVFSFCPEELDCHDEHSEFREMIGILQSSLNIDFDKLWSVCNTGNTLNTDSFKKTIISQIHEIYKEICKCNKHTACKNNTENSNTDTCDECSKVLKKALEPLECSGCLEELDKFLSANFKDFTCELRAYKQVSLDHTNMINEKKQNLINEFATVLHDNPDSEFVIELNKMVGSPNLPDADIFYLEKISKNIYTVLNNIKENERAAEREIKQKEWEAEQKIQHSARLAELCSQQQLATEQFYKKCKDKQIETNRRLLNSSHVDRIGNASLCIQLEKLYADIVNTLKANALAPNSVVMTVEEWTEKWTEQCVARSRVLNFFRLVMNAEDKSLQSIANKLFDLALTLDYSKFVELSEKLDQL